jgi:hypothetical protein
MSILKSVTALVAVISLVASGVATADPLSAGKPAGVKHAQMDSVPVMVWIGLAGITVAGIAAAAVSGSSPSTFTTVAASTGTGTTP